MLGSLAQAGGMYYGNRAPKAAAPQVQKEAITMPRYRYY
jgi:hypothetical protein